MKSLARQKKAAEIRFEIAVKAKELHEKGIEQVQEILDLTDGKFTSHGLYVFIRPRCSGSTVAHSRTRSPWQTRGAAYRFERRRGRLSRPVAQLTGIRAASGCWRARTCSCELQTMERRFLETNYRQLEVDQAFSLSQIDPAALIALRQTGECSFAVTEPFFSLVYPGFYKHAHQGRAADHPIDHGAICQRQRPAEPDAELDPADRAAGRAAGRGAAEPQRLDRDQHRPERCGGVRAVVPGRALHAVRGAGCDQRMVAFACRRRSVSSTTRRSTTLSCRSATRRSRTGHSGTGWRRRTRRWRAASLTSSRTTRPSGCSACARTSPRRSRVAAQPGRDGGAGRDHGPELPAVRPRPRPPDPGA